MVVNKTYLKIIFKEIKGSFGRFAAIFGIVALGVGFLSGLLVTTPDMHLSVDEYYDENNMADIFIKATMGLTKDDLELISSKEEVKELMPAYVTDALMETENREIITMRIYGLPLLDGKSGNINRLQLLEGRMPQKKDEVLAERGGAFLTDFNIGDKIKISSENEDFDEIDDIYGVMDYTVVGIVGNSFHFSMEREVTNIGNGRLGGIIYADEDSYNLDVYTDFYITIEGAMELDSFSSEYEEKMKRVVKDLEKIGEERSTIRYNNVLAEAKDELADGWEEYYEGKLEAETELADAEKELKDGRRELVDGLKELNDGKKELADVKLTLQQEVEDARKEIEDGKIELADALIELTDGDKELADAWIELQDGQKEYDDGYKDFLDAEKELMDGQREFDEGEEKYLEGLDELEDGKKEIQRGERELDRARKELEDGERGIRDGWRELNANKKTFTQGVDPIAKEIGYSSGEALFNDINRSSAAKQALYAYIDGANQQIDEGIYQIRGGIQLIDSGLTEAKSQLDGLNRQLEELNGNLHHLNAQIDELNAMLETVEEEEKGPLIEEINGLTIVKQGLEKGIKEIEKGMEEIESAIVKLNEKRIEAETQLSVLEEQKSQIPSAATLIDGWNQIMDGERELRDGEYELKDGWNQYYDGLDEIRKGKKDLEEGEKELADGKKDLEENRIKLQDGWKELEEGRIELADAKIQLEDGFKEYEDGKKDLEEGWLEYYDGLEEIADGEKTLEEEVAEANAEILDAEKDLAQGQRDYDEGLAELRDGEKEYSDAKLEVEEELAEVYIELMDAEEEIDKLEVPKWYVLDRNSNISFVSFELNSEKVSAVAKVFPIFFYMIAALVTLTTMTRMIEEERTQIGTLKALGYSKKTITAKYIVYCGLASFLGSAGGLFVGFKLIPYIIWNAYGVLFHLPDFIADYNTRIGLIASGLAILSTLGATIYACYDALKEKPATLMLPRAPKAGKRIMLERIKFIWSRLSFNHKATARNLFRYKKHFFMTVIGISGCTALLVAGFGLRDSIGQLAITQFSEIFKYELEIEVDNGWKDDTAFNEMLEDKSFIDRSIAVYSHKGDVGFKDGKEEVIIRAADLEELGEFIEFKDRSSNDKLIVNKKSIFITEKLSEVLELDLGDEFQLTDSDDKVAEFMVTGITENYAGNYVYMDKELFTSAFNVAEEENLILANPVDSASEFEDSISEKMLSNEKVLNSTFVSQTKSTFDNLLTAIDYVIVFIIVSSGALAFIVLYNLTNININERNKELATLKVLGYYEEEVSTYIFRETRILTFIGMLVGLGLGNLLHVFVILTVESPTFMFGRDVKPFSYLIAGLVTIVFSIIVNLFMKKKLANIKMVDSMKAND